MKRQLKKERIGSNRVENKISSKKRNIVTEQISSKKIVVWLFVIVVLTVISYSKAFDNEFTNWDDDRYVIENPNLKELESENIKAIFSEYYMGNYHPLAMLSLVVDYQIGGEDKDGNIKPFMFHFTNILLHVIVTLLVFWFLFELIGNFNIAVLAAILFGVHTLHVESVAWVAERKDVLYSAFFVASLFSYLKYLSKNKSKYLIFSIILFSFSLLSKGQAVSLAVTLVLIDWYRGRNLISRKVILEKIPFFVLSLIFGIIAIKAQEDGNAIISSEAYSVGQRVGFAGYAFMQYIIELIVPLGLSAINPYPDIINKTMPAYYWLFLLPSGAVAYAFFCSLKKSKEIFFAIAFFIINIFLLLQLIPVGSAVHADRYAYIPSIGYFLFISYGIFWLAEKKILQKKIILTIASIYIVTLIILTINRTEIWSNSKTLWDDTVEKSPKAVVAWNNRGSLADKSASDEFEKKEYGLQIDYKKISQLRKQAISDFTVAIKFKPDYEHAFYNRGHSKLEYGKMINDTVLLNSALEDFDFALEINPLFAEAYLARGNTKDIFNDSEGAIKDFTQAVELAPDNSSYYANRGVSKGKLGKFKEAVEDFNIALNLNPGDEALYSNRGFAYVLLNNFEAGMKDYNKSIEIRPSVKAYYNRSILKQKMNDLSGSLQDLNTVLNLDNSFTDAYYQRGLVYLLMNQVEKACPDLSKAVQAGHHNASIQFERNCRKNKTLKAYSK